METINERFDAARDATVSARLEPTPAQVTGWTDAVRQLDAWKAAAEDAIPPRAPGATPRPPALQRRGRPRPPDAAQPRRRAGGCRAQAGRRRSPTSASDTALSSMWLMLGVGVAAVLLGILIAWGLARAVTRHLQDAVSTLAATSTEILAATAQQASGAAEEETAIHQTTTTADEVRQTVALTTEKARAVAKDVRETADISREGRRAVDESVRGTQEARTRMETLAERILAPSASRRRRSARSCARSTGSRSSRTCSASTPASRPPRPATPAAGSRSSRSRSSRWPSSRARRSGRSATSSARSRPPPRPP